MMKFLTHFRYSTKKKNCRDWDTGLLTNFWKKSHFRIFTTENKFQLLSIHPKKPMKNEKKNTKRNKYYSSQTRTTKNRSPKKKVRRTARKSKLPFACASLLPQKRDLRFEKIFFSYKFISSTFGTFDARVYTTTRK